MKTTTKEERMKRIIARGEHSGHDHIVTGDVEVCEAIIPGLGKRIVVTVGEDSNASLKHLLEKPWLEEGKEEWTKEHHAIALPPGEYTFPIQKEYDAYNDRQTNVWD